MRRAARSSAIVIRISWVDRVGRLRQDRTRFPQARNRTASNASRRHEVRARRVALSGPDPRDIGAGRGASIVVATARGGTAARGLSLLRRFGPYAFQQLGQLGPVLLNSSLLRCGLLSSFSKGRELLSGRHQLGLEREW